MQALRNFFHLYNLLKIFDDKALIDDLILTLLYRLHYFKLLLFFTPRYHC